MIASGPLKTQADLAGSEVRDQVFTGCSWTCLAQKSSRWAPRRGRLSHGGAEVLLEVLYGLGLLGRGNGHVDRDAEVGVIGGYADLADLGEGVVDLDAA